MARCDLRVDSQIRQQVILKLVLQTRLDPLGLRNSLGTISQYKKPTDPHPVSLITSTLDHYQPLTHQRSAMDNSTFRSGPVKGRRALMACTNCRRLRKSVCPPTKSLLSSPLALLPPQCKQITPGRLDTCERCLQAGNLKECFYVDVANDPTAPRSNASGSRAKETVPDSYPVVRLRSIPEPSLVLIYIAGCVGLVRSVSPLYGSSLFV